MFTLALWFFLVVTTVTIWTNVAHPITALLNAATLTSAVHYWLAALVLVGCTVGLIIINYLALRYVIHTKSDSED